jgi:NADH:ubiquinone oxidoreductase subunit C
LRGSIAASNEKETRYLFFLTRIKDDFESSTDPIGAEYQKNLAQTQDKKGLYDLYMLYVDGEILRMKAKIETEARHITAAEELNSQALSKFSEIQNQENITPYLKQQIEASIKEIDTSNSY